PLDSIVKLIIADLNSAIGLLKATPRNKEVGRATAWTARAYKGRVQVYGAATNAALWDSALVTLRNVQANGPFKLETSFDHVWTVGRDKVPYKDWGLHNRGWIRDASYSGPYSPKKNVHEQAANAENNVGWQATQTNDVPILIFRYADLLLILAEAEIHATTGIL